MVFVILVACGSPAGGPNSDSGDDTSDAPWQGNDAGVAGVVSCYTEGNPSATCTLPSHCCFSNFTAQHNGSCSTSACAWGTIDCDGPEDCPSAQRCCARATKDANDVTTGYAIACQADPCGAPPTADELCHPTSTSAAGTCSTGSTCVTAFGTRNDLPRSLYVCR